MHNTSFWGAVGVDDVVAVMVTVSLEQHGGCMVWIPRYMYSVSCSDDHRHALLAYECRRQGVRG